MRTFALSSTALAFTALLAATPVRAEIEYPYCGYSRECAGGCTFTTLEQCREFVSGAGGSCSPNPRYTARASIGTPRPRR